MLRQSPVAINGVAVILGITGNLEGRVIFDMSEETAIKIAGAMNYEEFTVFDKLAKSTISELGNIIAGKAISVLNDDGWKFSITPPMLLCGNNMETTDSLEDTLVVPLETGCGCFNINVALKEKN
jgi:chemotaxis protein CheX